VIRASAGTGKTYQLSNRFLGLLAAGEPLDEILATTFTRKAAGEILARLLMRLAEAAADPEKLAELAGELKGAAVDRQRCLELLLGLVRRLHRIRVGTLDSFFIQMARSFGLELGLPPGWQIVDEIDDSALRAEAIRAVLRSEATREVVNLMHLLTKGEATRSVRDQIFAVVNDLYSVYIEAPQEAWEALPRPTPLADAEVQAAIEALAEAPCPSDKRFERACQETLDNARAENWIGLLKKGLTSNVISGQRTFYSKPIPDELFDACERLARHARAKVLGDIANQTLAARRLLERFDGAYQRLKLARRALRFEDVARMLGPDSIAARLDEIAYRLDAPISHLLLDEFQDTSPLQWRVLRPFAARVAGAKPHRSFFCVGDVKQAIYGWRGGEAEIFDALEEELPSLSAEPLNRSYRSSPVVIDTVNRVFGSLPANAAVRNYQEAAAQWARRFQTHSTKREDLSGHCRLVAAPRAKAGTDQRVMTWEFAVQEIERLYREAPGRSIGVLVRRNVAVAWLIRRLRQKKIEASEEGGNPLTDSPAVQWVLSLLAIADHPGHTAARFHVAHSPLGPVVGLTDYGDDAAARALSARLRAELMDQGYGPNLYRWARDLAPHCDARELARLMQLVEMGYGYEARATTRVDDFLTMVAETRVESPRAAAVRVMTVHQAKGLEFDIVVLPELDAKLVGQPPQVVVGRPGPARPIDRVLRYVSKDLWPLLPREFETMFAEHQRRMAEEAFCVLYVALTRAKRAIHLVVAPSAENEKNVPGTFAGVLRAALARAERLEPGAVAYEAGDPQWLVPLLSEGPEKRPEEAAEAVGPAVVRLAASPARLARALDRRSPSQLEGGGRVRLADRLRIEAPEAMDRGSLIHAWFELIEWLEAGEPDDDALRRAAGPVAFAGLDVEAVIRQFRAALARPAVRAALVRSTYERACAPGEETPIHAGPHVSRPRWQVSREMPFAVRDGDAILSGKIDRLVVLYEGNHPLGADVLDFKTDAIPPGDAAALDARVAWYRPQLAAYRRAACRLARLEPEHVSARLVFTEPGIVVPV
jgi:ATP-dependent exoDNAse (exonuclease V) beta subunit